MFVGYLLDALEFIRKDRKRAVVFSLVIFGLVAAFFGVLGQFIIFLLIVATVAVAFFVGQFELKKFGFELVTFTTVLTGFLYGPMVGLTVGLLLVIIHFILSKSLGPYVIYCVPAMAAVGLLAGYAAAGGWFGSDIFMIGVALSLAYNLFTGSVGSILAGNPVDDFIWSSTDFVINFVLFAKMAPLILSWIV